MSVRSASGLTAALTVVLPVFNETHRATPNVRTLVGFLDVLPAGSQLLFVDDGSTDGTADLIEKLLVELAATDRARVLREPHRGKGAAARAGLLAATTPLAGFADIDLATPLPSFVGIAHIAERAPVLAIGSRDLVGSNVLRRESPVREFLGRAFNRAVQTLVTPGIVDTQCGAKVARREVWSEILPASREDGWAWDVELCALARAAEIPVVEVAIEWVHDSGSNIRVARDGAMMVAALPRIRRTAHRFARTRPRRPAIAGTTSWRDRSAATLIVGALRKYAKPDGALLDLSGHGGEITGWLGWDPRAAIAIVAAPSAAAASNAVVVADAADAPVATGAASVVVVYRRTITDALMEEVARIVRPGGVVVALQPGGAPRTLSRPVRGAGLQVELATHAFSWCRATEGGRGRGALALTAIERVSVQRLGLRPPRGAAALVVARRLAPS